jgi:hypothetical protein
MTYEIHFIVFSLKESLLLYKKSLKISKRYSKSVNRRRTDNTMAKKKIGQKDKRTNNHLNILFASTDVWENIYLLLYINKV